MNWFVIAAETILFTALFTIFVFAFFGTDRKYTPGGIHNYPPDIQEEYFKTHERTDTSVKSKNVIATKLSGLIMFIAVLLGCSVLAGAKTFLQGTCLALGLMFWIGAYDTFFLDWVLFAKMKRFRLEGTEHMDKEYAQKWFHLKGMLFPGTLFALIISAAVGGLTAIIL